MGNLQMCIQNLCVCDDNLKFIKYLKIRTILDKNKFENCVDKSVDTYADLQM